MNSFIRAGLVASLCSCGTAFAQSAPGSDAPVMALQPHPTQPEWTKVCAHPGDRQNCYVTRDFVSAGGKAVLAIGYYQIRQPTERVIGRILLPLGLSLPAGIRVAIDDAAPVSGQFSTCVPTGCFAEFPLTPALSERFKKGEVIRIAAKNQYLAEIGFIAPLTGFASAYEGPAVSDQILAARQDNLRRHMQDAAAGR